MRMPAPRDGRGMVKIPHGWSQLQPGETTKEGDFWVGVPGSGEWRDDGYQIGVHANHYGPTIIFIRRTGTPQDKEWLNPWD